MNDITSTEEEITITYVTKMGEIPNNKTVKKGYKLTKEDLPVLSNEEYYFIGWYENNIKIKENTILNEFH